MDAYTVCVVVDGFDMDSEFQNASLECLNYEVAVSCTGGVTRVDADIEAASALDAVLQILADLKSINVTAVRLDPGLVSIPEIADRCDVSRETARLWTMGKRRTGFPSSYTVVGTTPLWFWADVDEWIRSEGIEANMCAAVPADIIEAMNGALAHVRNSRKSGWLMPTVAPVAHIAQRQVRHFGGWRSVTEAISA